MYVGPHVGERKLGLYVGTLVGKDRKLGSYVGTHVGGEKTKVIRWDLHRRRRLSSSFFLYCTCAVIIDSIV